MKTLTYRLLFVTSLLVLTASVWGQSHREAFEEKYEQAQDLIYDSPEKSIELGMSAFRIAEDAGDTWAMAIAKYGMGFISYEVGDYEAAYKNYASALETLNRADTVDLFNEVVILNELSLIHSDFNNHDQSIEFSKEALRIAREYVRKNRKDAEERGVLRWLVDIPYYMAIEYQAKGAHQTAGKILVELWDKAEDKEDVVSYAQVLNELGIIKKKNGEHSAAQEYFGIVVSGEAVTNEDKYVAYHNLAGTYLEQGEYDRAHSYYLIALDMEAEMEDKYSQFLTLQDMGELEYKRGNKDQAIEHWEAGLNLYSDVQTDPELYSVYNWLQLAYMDIDVEKAKEYNLKYSQLNDFYVKNQTVQRELEAQNREALNFLIDEQRQQRIDADQRQRFLRQFWPVLLGVGLLVLFSIMLGIRYYLALRSNKLLSRNELKLQQAQQTAASE